MKKISRFLLLFLVSCIMVFFSGCTSGETVYDHLMSYEATDEELELVSEGKLSMEYDRGDFDSDIDYYKYLANFYLSQGTGYLKQYAVLIIIISEILGITLLLLFRKSIEIRRFAVLVFIVGIPVLIILAIYGTAILADSF